MTFRDQHASVQGRADLGGHVAAAQQFAPGVALRRRGPVRQCQGTALADWTMVTGDGTELGTGTNMFELDADGRIRAAVGLAAPPRA